MIFLDSNIPMYLIGAPHPHKSDCQVLLERASAAGERLVTDAEVFQEILHRYTAIQKREAIAPAFRLLLDLVDEVFPIDKTVVLRAAEIAKQPAAFSGRDAVHIAVMEHHGVRAIMTFDADFDRWPGLKRLHRL